MKMANSSASDLAQWAAPPTPGIILGTFLAFCASYVVYYKYLHPLARFPGPLICSLTNIWKLWAVATDRMPDEIVKLHAKYGPVVRIGPSDLSFNAPEAVGDIYKQGWQKGEFYEGFKQPEPGLFSIRDEKLHGQRKRMFALGFSMPSIRSMEDIIDSRYAILRRQLDRFAQTKETFDLRRYITYCIVDVLGELAFSHPFGNQEAEDPDKIPPVSDALYGSCVAGQIPWATDVFCFIRDHALVPQVRKVMAALNVMVPIAVKNIQLRAEKKQETREDILGKLMAAREEKTGQPLSIQQIIAEAVTLIVGGTHTTGNSLHILFANLSRNPLYLQRVVEEIDKNLLPLRPNQAAYSIDGLEEKLDFVLAAIKESHRKDTVGTFNMPRTVPTLGAAIAGYHIPGGVSDKTVVLTDPTRILTLLRHSPKCLSTSTLSTTTRTSGARITGRTIQTDSTTTEPRTSRNSSSHSPSVSGRVLVRISPTPTSSRWRQRC